MKKVFTLSTCDTSRKILKQVQIENFNFEIKDIKTNKISVEELETLQTLAGSYEALFSRRAQKYKLLGLKDKTLSESDYKEFILSDYTFLKRPVVVDQDRIFIGNSKSNVVALQSYLVNRD